MSTKPEWLRKLEDKPRLQAAEQERRSQEIANEKRILSDGIPKLWERIFLLLDSTVKECDIPDVHVKASRLSIHYVRIEVAGKNCPLNGIDLSVQTEKRQLECKSLIEGKTRMLRFAVNLGKVIIIDGNTPLAHDEGKDEIEEAVQWILEPLLSIYA